MVNWVLLTKSDKLSMFRCLGGHGHFKKLVITLERLPPTTVSKFNSILWNTAKCIARNADSFYDFGNMDFVTKTLEICPKKSWEKRVPKCLVLKQFYEFNYMILQNVNILNSPLSSNHFQIATLSFKGILISHKHIINMATHHGLILKQYLASNSVFICPYNNIISA